MKYLAFLFLIINVLTLRLQQKGNNHMAFLSQESKFDSFSECIQPGKPCDLLNPNDKKCCHPLKCSSMKLCLPECLASSNCQPHHECLYGQCVLNPFAKFKPYKVLLMKKCRKSCSKEIDNFKCVKNNRKSDEKHCKMTNFMFSKVLGPDSCVSGIKSIEDYCVPENFLTNLQSFLRKEERSYRILRDFDSIDELGNFVMDVLKNRITVDPENTKTNKEYEELKKEAESLLPQNRNREN